MQNCTIIYRIYIQQNHFDFFHKVDNVWFIKCIKQCSYIYMCHIWTMLPSQTLMQRQKDELDVEMTFHVKMNHTLPQVSFGLRVMSLSVSVCVHLSTFLIHVITHHMFQLESSNLTHKMENKWLRSLVFLELIDLDIPGQIQLNFNVLFICITFASLKY